MSRLGHAGLHYGMRARCVKCREDHLTAECTMAKTSTSKCRCVNCGDEDHPASYKGCPQYKEAMAARQGTRNSRPTPMTATTTNTTYPKPIPPALNAKNFPSLKKTNQRTKTSIHIGMD